MDSMWHTCCILYSLYEYYYLHKVVSEVKKIPEEDYAMLHEILSKYELLFGGTLGTSKTKPVDVELQPNDKSHHAKM